ncbi:sensor histidine kinase [Antarctobacter sp.]|uniref:sensor histidine kinase n=1 Tax=Antarctobacter sp. TaxID=1872577 RepID=UPI002B265595|nr:histidine kinase dimerization/phosphoacceptor domain -containing protein [Antarctobacter sp.]
MKTRLKNLVRMSRSLSARIAVLMTIAMLPVGLIAVYQTQAVIDSARLQSRASLMSQIRSGATSERELIENALAASNGLAVLIAKLGEDNCGDILRGFVEGNDNYIFAGFVRSSGWLACSSTGDTMDLSGRDTVRRAMERGGASVQLVQNGAVTGRSIVIVTQPVRGDDDEIVGFVSLSIPHATVLSKLEDPDSEGGLRIAAIDIEGDLIAASLGLDAAEDFLPRDIPLSDLVQGRKETFQAPSGTGEDRYYAVTPMLEGKVMLVGSWPLSSVPGTDTTLQSWIAIALPVLMWIAGVGVALFGVQRLVIRHVAQLRSAMRRFALGEREATTLELTDPPAELEEAQRAFNRMALLIAEGELRREQDLKDKEVLLREVHHRVKNNLQLIASIMNMQARELETDEAKHVVSELQRRVRGMAVLHRALYNTPTSTTVDAAALVRAVVSDVQDLVGPKVAPEIDTVLEQIALYPDQAIPLSLFVAETLNNTIIQACRRDAGDRIGVNLSTADDGGICLSIDSPPVVDTGTAPAERLDGMGRKMITAFLLQMGGTMETTTEDGRYRTTVRFPRAAYGA